MKRGMIPIFIPHVGCPHICVFCNQTKIANTVKIPNGETVKNMIMEYTGVEEWAENKDRKAQKRIWEVAFYGGSFTAISPCLQIELLKPAKEALDFGIIHEIRCSTRPDSLSIEEIEAVKKYGMNTIEIGVQSMDDVILEKAQRGHSEEDVVQAVANLKAMDMNIGIQLMPGLPGDTWETIKETTKKVAELKPDFVRIYPVLVIEDTELADFYRLGEYQPLEKEIAIEYCAWMKTYFEERDINVIRVGLQATDTLDSGESLVAGPYSPSFGEEVVNRQILTKIEETLETEKNNKIKNGEIEKTEQDMTKILGENIIVLYARKITSKVRGVKNKNINILKEKYPVNWKWQENKELESDIIKILFEQREYKIKI